MARPVTYFEDDRGKAHKSPDEAVAADIAAALGMVGETSDLSIGIAQKVIANREAILAALAQLDELRAAAGPEVEAIPSPAASEKEQ